MSTTREQLIETTCALLELQGYHATGLNQIIKESGSPKGSLYYHFPGGKEELAAEALAQVGDIVLNRIRDSLARVDDPADAVQTFMMFIAHNIELSDYKQGAPITTVALEATATSERLREQSDMIYSAWQNAFAEKLRDSEVDDARANRIAALIISAIEGSTILCRTSRSTQPMKDAAEEIKLLITQARS